MKAPTELFSFFPLSLLSFVAKSATACIESKICLLGRISVSIGPTRRRKRATSVVRGRLALKGGTLQFHVSHRCEHIDDLLRLPIQIFTLLSLNDAPHVAPVCKRFATLFWSARIRVSFKNFRSKFNYHDQFVCLVTKQARNLQWLDLSNAPFLSDTGLSFIVNHAPRIRRVSLGPELNNVSDRGVTRLCTLSHLDALYFPSLPALTNKGLAAIAAVTSLTALELGHVYIANDAGFVKLTLLTNLVELRIAHCPQLSDGAVGPLLSRLTALRRVSFASCAWVSLSISQHLERLSHLERVDIADCVRLAQWRDLWPQRLLPLVRDEMGDQHSVRSLTSASIPPPMHHAQVAAVAAAAAAAAVATNGHA